MATATSPDCNAGEPPVWWDASATLHHRVHLVVMQTVDELFSDAGIEYWLSAGTLMGVSKAAREINVEKRLRGVEQQRRHVRGLPQDIFSPPPSPYPSFQLLFKCVLIHTIPATHAHARTYMYSLI